MRFAVGYGDMERGVGLAYIKVRYIKGYQKLIGLCSVGLGRLEGLKLAVLP